MRDRQISFSLFTEMSEFIWKTLTQIGNNSLRCSICRLTYMCFTAQTSC